MEAAAQVSALMSSGHADSGLCPPRGERVRGQVKPPALSQQFQHPGETWQDSGEELKCVHWGLVSAGREGDSSFRLNGSEQPLSERQTKRRRFQTKHSRSQNRLNDKISRGSWRLQCEYMVVSGGGGGTGVGWGSGLGNTPASSSGLEDPYTGAICHFAMFNQPTLLALWVALDVSDRH